MEQEWPGQALNWPDRWPAPKVVIDSDRVSEDVMLILASCCYPEVIASVRVPGLVAFQSKPCIVVDAFESTSAWFERVLMRVVTDRKMGPPAYIRGRQNAKVHAYMTDQVIEVKLR